MPQLNTRLFRPFSARHNIPSIAYRFYCSIITGPRSKDITEKDIEKDLIDNDPSEGFETDIDTQNSSEEQSDTFEIIAPDQDNPVKREFEIGQLGNQEIQEDELTRDESDNSAPGHDKPSQRKF
ncbi:hypothetical protein ACFSJW_01605 [Flavobacterium artemisiae]|uniref:Uncharacterized protein n=1 Tax=Flavobacterium artemisiae TaxID=2126556 RepID=A0ABW4HK91_9FLAO